jgi:phosphatidylglycerol---prolipoprotein diacylglyceryl transferase
MVVINIDPVIFTLGPLSVRWYGLMYIVGITAGAWVAWQYAKTKGITLEQIETILLYSVPAGLVGARLYFVFQQPLGPYISEPWKIIAFWEGGMAFYGAIFAVVITIVVLAWRMKIPVWTILDTAVIFATVGQFFGRIGNIINGDVIGYPTSLPWGFIYAHPDSFAPRHDIAYQPAAVYEAIIDIILFTILWRLRNKFRAGILFFIYIFGYSLSQILVFIVRDNEIILFGFKQAQLTAMGVIIAAALLFWWYIRRQNRLNTQN